MLHQALSQKSSEYQLKRVNKDNRIFISVLGRPNRDQGCRFPRIFAVAQHLSGKSRSFLFRQRTLSDSTNMFFIAQNFMQRCCGAYNFSFLITSPEILQSQIYETILVDIKIIYFTRSHFLSCLSKSHNIIELKTLMCFKPPC